MTVGELDRSFLSERCSVLNAFFEEVIDFDTAKDELDLIDFKFETLISLEMISVLEPAKPFDWSQE
jgi:hypothetical protein